MHFFSDSETTLQPRLLPSLLSCDFSHLADEIKSVEEAGCDGLHIDVMDGHFVPNLTLGPPIIKAIRKTTSLPLDVHLMIEKPDRHLQAFVDAGADLITVHAEACVHLHRTIQTIKTLGCDAGVALNPATPLTVLDHILGDIDMVLLMTVNPGFGGQVFISEGLNKIKTLKKGIEKIDRPVAIEVDGGIKLHNVASVIQAGARMIVAGSAVFGAPDIQEEKEKGNSYKEVIKKFRKEFLAVQ